MSAFGEMLRIWMAAKRVSCRELAREVGTSSSTISRICNGETVDADTLILLINWLFKAKGAEPR